MENWQAMTKLRSMQKKRNNRCTFHIWWNSFRGIKRPDITIWICQAQRLTVVCAEGWGYILTLIHLQRADGLYFNILKHSEHCGHCETYSKQPPPSLCMPTLSHPDLDIQATRPPPPPPSLSSDNSICLSSAWWTSPQSSNSHRARFGMQPQCVAVVKPPYCVQDRAWVSSHSNQKVLPPALWQSPLPLEPLIITCEGGLVIFLIILHFISIPPFKTQHENWLPQRSIFIISPKPINYPTLGQGGRAVQAQADPFRSRALQCVGGAMLNGAALLLAENGRGKKTYTCYLVNPQTCKIGISWMSETEMELTRDLFIVTEGH